MKLAGIFALGFVMLLPACDRIESARIDVQYWRSDRRERRFHEDMERIAHDTHGAYQLDYVITDDWMPNFVTGEPEFHALQNGQFDMIPWLQKSGVEPSPIASAIFDPAKRKVTIIDTGPNIAAIEVLIEPLRPTRYRAIKTPAAHKP
jgi:hypothetical protein